MTIRYRSTRRVEAYRVLNGIGGDDGGVVTGGVRREAVGGEADANVPLDDDIANANAGAGTSDPPPNPRNPNPSLSVLLIEL